MTVESRELLYFLCDYIYVIQNKKRKAIYNLPLLILCLPN